MQHNEKKRGIVIPQNKLSQDVLTALVDEFILREGTDYGTHEYSLEQKRQQILKQLAGQHILILFDPDLESTTLIRKEELTKLSQQNFEIVR